LEIINKWMVVKTLRAAEKVQARVSGDGQKLGNSLKEKAERTNPAKILTLLPAHLNIISAQCSVGLPFIFLTLRSITATLHWARRTGGPQ